MDISLDVSPILVGIDDSPSSRVALSWAIDEATRRNAPLHLVHAWRPMYHTHLNEFDYFEMGEEFQSHGDKLLSTALDRVRAVAPQLQLRGSLVKGRPSAVLLHHAAGARMLVVGSRGLGGFSELLLGSVGLHVVAHAPCPVVVMRSTPRTGGPIIVGIDGSAHSESVLAAAFDEASVRSAALLATWAIYIHSRAEGVHDPDSAQSSTEQLANAAMQELLHRWSSKYPAVTATAAFPVGHAAEALVKASAAGQLLIVGSHGGGGFSGMNLGSITYALVHHAHCPVMVVRAGEGAR